MRIHPSIALVLLGACNAALASPTIQVVFNDPSATYASYYDDITRVTVAAGDAWIASFSQRSDSANLMVSIGFEPIATANGRSTTATFLGTGSNGLALYGQGAAYELMTGIDPNGSAADVALNLGINGYLQNELWFDPSPALRLAAVPADRTDAVSVLLHEFGHAFAFNGWRDGITGDLPGNYESTFDALVSSETTLSGISLRIDGPLSRDLYGGPMSLTLGNYGHLGNLQPDSGHDLVSDLMNGIVFERGTRYEISALDLRLMADMGLPVTVPAMLPVLAAVPEPATTALLLAGLCGLAALRQVRTRSDVGSGVGSCR